MPRFAYNARILLKLSIPGNVMTSVQPVISKTHSEKNANLVPISVVKFVPVPEPPLFAQNVSIRSFKRTPSVYVEAVNSISMEPVILPARTDITLIQTLCPVTLVNKSTNGAKIALLISE